MIVPDTSVWVDFFRGTPSPEAERLKLLISRVPLLVGDLMLCEILQGVPTERQAREVETALRAFDVVPMVGDVVATAAAAHFRTLRAQGITVRKTIDLLIGAFCIHHGHILLHRDRDFDPIARHLGLKVLPV